MQDPYSTTPEVLLSWFWVNAARIRAFTARTICRSLNPGIELV
jgi:hypothetical protein